MIEIDRLCQGYGRTQVLSDLTLRLGAGRHALLGPNGAGKSTLLRTLATILAPQSGQVLLEGVAYEADRLAQLRPKIGYLPQRFGFDPAMTVREFVSYAAWARGVPRPHRRAAVEDALAKTGLTPRRDTKMRKLSGGMIRRAGIAWAIVGDPPLILLDEPTVGLDPMQRINFRDIISRQADSTIIVSTHLIEDVDAMAERVVVLDEGEVHFHGTPVQLAEAGRSTSPGATALERGYTSILVSDTDR